MTLTMVFSPFRSTVMTQRSRRSLPDPQSVGPNALRIQVPTDTLASDVVPDGRNQPHIEPAARHHDRLVRALAAEIVGRAPGDDRLARLREPVDLDDGVDRSVADDVNHRLSPSSS